MSSYFKISDYWDYFLGNEDYIDLFRTDLTRRRMCELFNKFVLNVNIETSSFCNRKCGYCPLSYIDRKQNLMDDSIWNKCIEELREIDYKGRITFALYNEPLLDPTIFEKLAYVKSQLPETYTTMYSNGDYLTLDKLEKISSSQLDWMLITRHVSANEFDQEKCKAELLEYINKIGLNDYIIDYHEMNSNNCSYLLKYNNLDLYIVTNNWNVVGVNRGGMIEKLNTKNVRTLPCAKAIRDFCISYDGTIKPCCNRYFGDNNNYGSINKEGIVNSYFNNLRDFRLELVKFGNKHAECMYCGEPDNAKIETRKLRNMIG